MIERVLLPKEQLGIDSLDEVLQLKDQIFPPNGAGILSAASTKLDEWIGMFQISELNGGFSPELFYLGRMLSFWIGNWRRVEGEANKYWLQLAKRRRGDLTPLWVGVCTEFWDDGIIGKVSLYLEEGVVWRSSNVSRIEEFIRWRRRVELGLNISQITPSTVLYLRFNSSVGELGRDGFRVREEWSIREALGVMSLKKAQEVLEKYKDRLLEVGGKKKKILW